MQIVEKIPWIDDSEFSGTTGSWRSSGYNSRYRGKGSYDPLLCLEANSSFLRDAYLRPGNAGT